MFKRIQYQITLMHWKFTSIATDLRAGEKGFISISYKLFASNMGGILIFDQLLLTLIDHVLYKVSSSGTECANLSPLRVQGLDSSECLFYAQRGINLLKLNGTDLSPACVKAHPFKVFQPTLWLVTLDRLSISLLLLVIRHPSSCVCCRWGNR